MSLREWYLHRRVVRAGGAVVRADARAARAEERLRAAVRRLAAIKAPPGAALKALWPAAARDRDADYREVQLRG